MSHLKKLQPEAQQALDILEAHKKPTSADYKNYGDKQRAVEAEKKTNKKIIMNILEYQQLAKRTNQDLESFRLNIWHMNYGIMTELGEMVDPIKKNLAYGKDIDFVNVAEEMADCCWYVVNKALFENEELEEPSIIESSFDFTMESLFRWHGFSNQSLLNDLFTFCNYMNIDFYKSLENNINKLKVRYPEKFTKENAINRDLEAERKELER
jgi:NTP pyrophosphatase (non-canonical NTP hydrolase)